LKLIAKKGGNGYVSSYTLNISLKMAQRCGFVDDNGTTYEVELIEQPENRCIVIKPIFETKSNN